MFHDFDSEPIGPGLWRHRCRRCGATFDRGGPAYIRLCDYHTELPRGPQRLAWPRWIRSFVPKPGDVMKALIHATTAGQASHGLNCEIRRQRMNAAGWRGCWRQRAALLKMLRDEAAKEGYRADWPALIGHLALGLARLTIAGAARAANAFAHAAAQLRPPR